MQILSTKKRKILTVILPLIIVFIGMGCLVYNLFFINNDNTSYLYPKNNNGQTYGSSAYAGSVDDLPDLIRVKGKYGNVGYIYKDDYLLNTKNDYERYSLSLSESELKRARESHKNDYADINKVDFYKICYDVPVYDETGDTIIDKFTFSIGTYPYS